MPFAGVFRIPAEHPCFAGHFPGRPIVPGVMLLDQAFDLILAAFSGWMLQGVGAAKFVAPVLPDMEVAVEYRVTAPGDLAYTCAVAGRPVLRGSARLKPIGDPR